MISKDLHLLKIFRAEIIKQYRRNNAKKQLIVFGFNLRKSFMFHIRRLFWHQKEMTCY